MVTKEDFCKYSPSTEELDRGVSQRYRACRADCAKSTVQMASGVGNWLVWEQSAREMTLCIASDAISLSLRFGILRIPDPTFNSLLRKILKRTMAATWLA